MTIFTVSCWCVNIWRQMQFCSSLFDCGRYSKAKKHTAEQRKQLRLEKEKPILDAFWDWLGQQRPNRGTRLAKAVDYAQNRKDTLMTIWKMTTVVFLIISVGMQSGHSQLAGKTGCSVPALREPQPVLSCRLWLKWQKRMIWTLINIWHISWHNDQMIKCQMNSWSSSPHGVRLWKLNVKTKIE